MKLTTRRINVNLTELEEKYLDYLKTYKQRDDYLYNPDSKRVPEADIVREAIQFYAIECGYYKPEKLARIDKTGNIPDEVEWDGED